MTGELRTRLGIDAPDDFYEALIEAHAGLSEDESMRLNARLILLLANHVGERAILDQAIAAAKAADRS
ncbi:MAG: DUF2783 domain-containing protein [Alphaproteobacteria bacterium]|nr:DUF2783 domain-containing protein [Alphaproteobacteria bacterium]|tara:strand:+ start:1036 stop:1239 length:204 start_codon:yes stop_codon:yes gene_type:complete